MDVVPDIWQHVEQSSAVDDEKYEEKRLFQSTSLESDSEACEGDESDFDVGDMYHLDIIVALTETESGEEDSVFIDALTEIEGKNSFPCSKCNKICKSKGGLTKHTDSKHRGDIGSPETDQTLTPLCKDTISSIVESSKRSLLKIIYIELR